MNPVNVSNTSAKPATARSILCQSAIINGTRENIRMETAKENLTIPAKFNPYVESPRTFINSMNPINSSKTTASPPTILAKPSQLTNANGRSASTRIASAPANAVIDIVSVACFVRVAAFRVSISLTKPTNSSIITPSATTPCITEPVSIEPSTATAAVSINKPFAIPWIFSLNHS